jgi:hypothetical protein
MRSNEKSRRDDAGTRGRRVPPVPRTWGPGNPYKSPPSNSTVIQRSAATKNLQLFSATLPPTAFRKLVKTLASSVTPRNSVQPISDLHISLHKIFCANIAGYFFDRRILVLKPGIERHRATDRFRRVRILRHSIAKAVKSGAEVLCGDNFVANRYIRANLQRPIRRTDGVSRSCMKNTGRVRKICEARPAESGGSVRSNKRCACGASMRRSAEVLVFFPKL